MRFKVLLEKVDCLPTAQKTNFLRYATREGEFYLVPLLYCQNLEVAKKHYQITLVRKNKNGRLFSKVIEDTHLPTEQPTKHQRYFWRWEAREIYSEREKIYQVITVGQPLIVGHHWDENFVITKSEDLSPEKIPQEVLFHNNLLRELLGYKSFCGQLHETTITLHASRDEKHDFFVWELSTSKFVHGKRNKLAEITPLKPNEYVEKVFYDETGKYSHHEVIYFAKEYREDIENFTVEKLDFSNFNPERSKPLDSNYEEKEEHISFSESLQNPDVMFDRMFAR